MPFAALLRILSGGTLYPNGPRFCRTVVPSNTEVVLVPAECVRRCLRDWYARRLPEVKPNCQALLVGRTHM